MAKKVLICDDDDGIVEVATIVLEDVGYDVVSITSAEKIVELASEKKPDVILMDLWMPEVSGEEATKMLRAEKNTKDIPIIIVSANKDTEQIAIRAGANDFICKPFDIDELEGMVNKHANA